MRDLTKEELEHIGPNPTFSNSYIDAKGNVHLM